MNRYSRIFKYLGQYKGKIATYFLCILLSTVFSILSMGMLMPFFELIFNGDSGALADLAKNTSNPIVRFIRNFLIDSISGAGGNEIAGKLYTLGILCLIIIGAIVLKNVFLVMAQYILNPLKNRIVNQLRIELYNKILHLPIGFFTEKKKGDLISRITNDVGEVEGSLVGALEGWVRDPLQIVINFAVLFFISPKLTFFLLFFIPVIGLVIGRISRSLKRQSNEAAIKHSESVSVLDETLGGLRVIKAFNLEGLLRNRFYTINEELVDAKNRIAYRRDLASPTSEVLGVIVFCCILK